jgi:uncharacterized membrane protein
MKTNITRAQRKFIKKNYGSLSIDAMAEKLGIAPDTIRQALTALGLTTRREHPPTKIIEQFFDRFGVIILTSLAIAYVLFVSYICLLRLRSFNYVDFDMSVHNQSVWNVLHGSIDSSILGIPFLGNHLSLLLFLIAPLYALFPAPLTLLLLQTLFIGLAVIPLYLFAREVLGNALAVLFGGLYLFYPALHYVNRYEFHPVAFSIFFLLSMFYCFEKQRFRPFLFFMLLSLACKENISFAIFMFGFYALFCTNRASRWGLVAIAAALFWFLVPIRIMFHLNQGIIDFSLIYKHLGDTLPQAIGNIITQPSLILEYGITRANAKFLFQLFFPLLFLPVLAPKTLFIIIPFFLQQLLSTRTYDHTIQYHYTAKLIPFLFISAVYGMRFLLGLPWLKHRRWPLVALLLTATVISNVFFGWLPHVPGYFPRRYAVKAIDRIKEDLIKRIPKDASVVATFEFLPKLSSRKHLYAFHHVYIGTYTLSATKAYELPRDVDYALLNFDDYLMFTSFYKPDSYRNLQKFFARDSWGLVKAVDSIALFKNGHASGADLIRPLDAITPLSSVRFLLEHKATTWGYAIHDRSVRPGGAIGVSFLWECLEETDRDYWLSFRIFDKNNRLLHQYNHPICYRIRPTFSWRKGDIIKENVWILVPPGVSADEVVLKMVVFDRKTAGLRGGEAKTVPIMTNAADIFDKDGMVVLGTVAVER